MRRFPDSGLRSIFSCGLVPREIQLHPSQDESPQKVLTDSNRQEWTDPVNMAAITDLCVHLVLPEGAPSSAVMTHDIETARGRDLCSTMMDIDDAYGVKASFGVVSELRYEVPTSFLDSIPSVAFEVAVHDLNHDGR